MKSQARNSTNPVSVCTRGLRLLQKSLVQTLQLTSQLWYKMVFDCTLFSTCESFSCLMESTLKIAPWLRVHIALINKQKCTVLPPIVYFSCLQTLSINNAGSTPDCDWNVNETRFLPCSSVGLWSSRQLFLRQIWVTTLRGVICAHTGPFSQRLSCVEFSPAPFAFFFFFF